ncbi:type IV pilus assembly protein PilM [Planctomycetes bacterium K23_9]|uniref:Competence protein A n=1 Tax=Stieleria marina TaxID=1930275 RepID=A0A517NVY6_9BACT|nr:Competence protein A [Planctomycetes bacterium K23_9]
MASSAPVWGIEIGQSAIKALRCSLVDGEVVASAFDFIEYPKILSQPEAVPEELIADAMAQLLERNDSFNEKVCISVPGQSGLAKFFKPPPVEVKKIADIVRYEARQQIPFDLADVVWDFQMMPGSMVEEGYALESEVGLFAMKREQAYRQLAPFDDANVEVDVVQLAPLALYNMVAYDRMNDRLENEAFDADNPPPSTVVLSIGTDSSDLIVTNGFRIWQRSMPIGGNHFTRQLSKDLKLTFAKAEHLKRNAREAVDPKLIFQTMRPVFNDLVTEVQRSIGFFRSIDRKAEIADLVVTGNTVKMPGLAAYLGKNLGFEVHTMDRFNRLGGDDVLSIPTFRDNASTFAVCYGLCLQGLGQAQVHASLVPAEILRTRMIRAKKPWALMGLTALMFGMSAHYTMTQRAWSTSHPDVWKGASSAVSTMDSYASGHRSTDGDLSSQLVYLDTVGHEVTGNAEKRLMWLEIIRAVNGLIPREEYPEGKVPTPAEKPLVDRIDFHITEFETKHYADLAEWYTDQVVLRVQEEMIDWHKVTKRPMPEADAGVEIEPPTGEGWVIQLQGFHYYNSPERMGEEGSNHIRKYLTTAFKESPIRLPDPRNKGQMLTWTPQEMGLSFPLLLNDTEPYITKIPNPDYDPTTAIPGMAAPVGEPADGEDAPAPAFFEVPRQDFTYQIVWQPKTLSERIEARKVAQAEQAALDANAPPIDDMPVDGAATDTTGAPIDGVPTATPPTS